MKIDVIRAGFLTTIQDRGRTGSRSFGVSLSGALDAHALRVANLLVGNDDGDAGIEITFGGLRLRFADERIVAWCGGQFDVRVGSRSLPPGHAALVRPQEELAVAQPKLGCRAWIAISGGLDVPVVLGSRSTDWRAKLGGVDGRALRDGDQVPMGALSESAQSLIDLLRGSQFSSWSPPVEWISSADTTPILRFVRGADWDRFDASAHDAFTTETFRVTSDSDRMGARLDGPELKRHEDVDLVSEAVAPGTVQVPPNGHPIVLLGDCQTIGGYPKIAHVVTVDLPIAAQLQGGDAVRFQEISLADAHHLLLERESEFERFRIGVSLHVK